MSDRPGPPATDWLLPPDIEVIIIDHFLDDKPTLFSCSLVCSRWLPRSRKHLFKDITIKLAKHLTHDPLADFLRIVERSGAVNPEWSIGRYLKVFHLNGKPINEEFNRGSPTAIRTLCLSVLPALLATLPHITSLFVTKFLIIDDTSQEHNMGRYDLSPLQLDALSITSCLGPTRNPHPLFALLCMFSNIKSLVVEGWGDWRPSPAFSLPPLSPPIVRSLAIDMVKDATTVHALYALLASSPSVTDANLTRISVHADDYDDIKMFSDFVNVAGAALREVELRVEYGIRSDLLEGIPLNTCTNLSSLTLCFECNCDDPPSADAADTRGALSKYTAILRSHRNVFVRLANVRLEIRPVGRLMLDAFVRVAQDTFREWPAEVVDTVLPEEAEENRVVWAFLEDSLCELSALERVEFVLYETLRTRGALTETAKAELRSALEGRLPRLGPRGNVHLVFETCVY